jgi:transposase
MRDTDLYGRLLGLHDPWFVARVDLRLVDQCVEVWVEHAPDARWLCPECGVACSLYDHAEERTWRHLDTMQYKTLLHARPPRVNCDEHGIRQARLPWAEERSRFTLLFETFAIDVLKQTSVRGAQQILGLTYDEAWRIKHRAVRRGLSRQVAAPPRLIGVDEKSALKGHKFLTIVSDLERRKVLWVAFDRTTESLGDYFEQLGDGVEQIEAVAMDMWPAYLRATREHIEFAETKIVYDHFHVAAELSKAVDLVRKSEHRALLKKGDRSLNKTKYWWLANQENVARRNRHVFGRLRTSRLRTARAWAIKEMLRRLWHYKTLRRAMAYWKRWYAWARRSRLEPIVAAAQKLWRNRQYIFNYFTHRITNATAESMNAQIDKIKRVAHGFRNLENFRTAIFFHLGGLDLYPDTHAKA